MITGLKNWLLGVILTAFASAMARQMTPKGKEQAVVRWVSGLLMILALLRPLVHVSWEGIPLAVGSIQSQTDDVAEEYRQTQKDQLSGIIAEQTEAYICNKAQALGFFVEAQVTVAVGDNTLPLPDRAVLTGPYKEELATWIAEEVGIPAERQIWLEESTWTKIDGPS